MIVTSSDGFRDEKSKSIGCGNLIDFVCIIIPWYVFDGNGVDHLD